MTMDKRDDKTPRATKCDRMTTYIEGRGVKLHKPSEVPDEWQVPHDLRPTLLDPVWP